MTVFVLIVDAVATAGATVSVHATREGAEKQLASNWGDPTEPVESWALIAELHDDGIFARIEEHEVLP